MRKAAIHSIVAGAALLIGIALLILCWPSKALRPRAPAHLKQVGLQFQGGYNDLSRDLEYFQNLPNR